MGSTGQRLYAVAILLGLLLLLLLVMASPHADSTSTTVLITAVYYDTYLAHEPDEAFRLTNVSDATVDLSGWTVTDEHGTIALNGSLQAGASLWITAEAVFFAQEFGFAPDYEYGADTDPTVPNLAMSGNFKLANNGDVVTLNDSSGAEADCVIYEDGDSTACDWSGSPVEPYDGIGVDIERAAVLGPDEAEGSGVEGQILYRKLDQVTGLPVPDTDTAADWAQDPDDDINGKKVMYPGWDLEQYFFTKTFTEPASLLYAIGPDHIYEAVESEIEWATTSIYVEGYTFKNASLADVIVARMQAKPGLTVKVLLEGDPVGGIVDQQKWICHQIENAGGEVWFMYNDDAADAHDRYSHLHGKWMIIDEQVLLTGSEDLNRSSMPADDKTDGRTEGNRGIWLITSSRTAVAYALGVFRQDLDPDNHRDLIRWTPSHPTYGAPPPGFSPDYSSGGDAYKIEHYKMLEILTVPSFELVHSPENSLRDQDCLLGMVARAGTDDTVLVQQMYEYPYWGPAGSNPSDDPNPRLEAYIAAARRGARVRILLDSFYDNPGDVRSNVVTCSYANGIANAEGLDLACRRVNPTGTGISNKMVLVWAGGKGYAHTGSINGSENSSKNNREFAVQVQSTMAYWYLSGVFWDDWAKDYERSTYLPLITDNVPPCAGAGEEIPREAYSQGVRCCPGLARRAPARVVHPCDTPGEGDCDLDGCTFAPLCFCYQCSPCGNGSCEPEYGENRCNCKADCDE